MKQLVVNIPFYEDEDTGEKVYDLEGLAEDIAMGISVVTEGELQVDVEITED